MTSPHTETPNQAARSQQAGRERNARNQPESRGAESAKENAKRRRSRDGKQKTDLYTDVTAKIVRELEAGRFPWAQPWAARGEAATIAAGLPKNASQRRRHRSPLSSGSTLLTTAPRWSRT